MIQSPPLPHAPAAERNRGAIFEVLAARLPESGTVLEIGAGTGQHAVAFSRQRPDMNWLATDRLESLPGLIARTTQEGGKNLLKPRALEVTKDAWPQGPFQAAYTANTTHIMSWEAVCAMLAGVASVLEDGAPLFIYGPFRIAGQHTTPSNQRFHESLQARDPAMGVRDRCMLEREGLRHQLRLVESLSMPANNFTLVLRKDDRKQT